MHNARSKAILLFVLVAAFSVLIFGGAKIDQYKPPMPARVVDASGTAVFTYDDIMAGQRFYLAHGGQHIHKEDAILYPMAEQRLPPEVLERVDADCLRYEELKTGSGEPQRLLALADELRARHAPLQEREDAPATSHAAFRGGCCP